MRRLRRRSERAMTARTRFRFRLYVAGDAPNSAQALANLAALCRAHLPDRHEIEVVDVFREPKRVLADGVFMTPTLVKLAPLPIRRIVGTLSQTQLVLQALGLEPFAAPARDDHGHAGWHRRRPEARAA
ncbi:MAG: circadian clock protein KaiB [Betaproteobacteria bacterium]|nr:MAG: circadian clock protein KaiB [Betaproteobacteria bacterium]